MNCSEDCGGFCDLDSRNHSMSLPGDESVIIRHFNLCFKSSCYLSIRYDKLAVIALLPFYEVLYAVLIKKHGYKNGHKVEENFKDFFFFLE